MNHKVLSITDLLETRRNERDTLLQRAVDLLKADERVCAAWLFGSLGRGIADDLSDLDLWVVVADVYLEEVLAERYDFIARLAEPLLIEEAPQNAPAGGGYMLALYRGEVGPHQVDWYWQPASHATIPKNVLVLLNRAGVPKIAQLEAQSEESRAETAAERVVFFWAMCNIAAKKIARRQAWAALRMLDVLAQTLDGLKPQVGEIARGPGYEYESADSPPGSPADQLTLLRKMAHEMEELAPHIEGMGGNMPSEAISQIYRFFDLADTIISEGGGMARL